MNLLDENIRHDQAEQLRKWRIKFRLLTKDIVDSGTQDPDVISALHRLKQPTFFTHDQDYFRYQLLHKNYSLIWLDIFDGYAALSIRKLLKHPAFATHTKRMGTVARVHADGIDYWRKKVAGLIRLRWE